jgi:hypothetical protein
MRSTVEGASERRVMRALFIRPREAGEGDHAKHGGGGLRAEGHESA